MIRAGRKEPYTTVGVTRLKCVRCGTPATQQWQACADGLWRPICTDCDIELNRMVLEFMMDPDADEKLEAYKEKMGEL